MVAEYGTPCTIPPHNSGITVTVNKNNEICGTWAVKNYYKILVGMSERK